jgi:hypothetical protein
LSWTTEKRSRNKEQTQAKKIRWETTVWKPDCAPVFLPECYQRNLSAERN